MIIQHFGDGFFRLQSGDFTVLVDPTHSRMKGEVILKTLTPVEATASPKHEIAFSGEYEIGGLEIQGWELPQESGEKFLKTIYRVKWENLSFVFLGHLSKVPDEEILENIGESDVLFIPCGGGHFLSAESAAKLAKQLQPRLVIPSFFKSPAEFLKAIGQKTEPEEKLVFKKKDLAHGVPKVVVLKSAGA